MDAHRRYQLGNLVIFAGSLAHAALTWPLEAALLSFGAGALIALLAEAVVVWMGLLEHALEPTFLGVPVTVVLVWPAIVYLCLRVALLALPVGLAAVVLAALIGTAVDLVTEPFGLAEGVWRYPEHRFSRPRIGDMPWWNSLGWFCLVCASAAVPVYGAL
jgi:putative membrane protein